MKPTKRFLTFIILLLVIGYTLLASLAFAEGYTLNVPIPGLPTGEVTGIGQFIKAIYNWGLGIVGLVAFAMIVWGAIEYTVSAGNASRRQDAVDRITQAIVGLALLLGAYVILYTIDPGLVTLKEPGGLQLEEVQSPDLTVATTIAQATIQASANAQAWINDIVQESTTVLTNTQNAANETSQIKAEIFATQEPMSFTDPRLIIYKKAVEADKDTQSALQKIEEKINALNFRRDKINDAAAYRENLLQNKPTDPRELTVWNQRMDNTLNALGQNTNIAERLQREITSLGQSAEQALARARQAKGEFDLWLSQQNIF